MTLPRGFEVTLDRSTRVLDGGRALLGGNPVRLVRLGARARPLLSGRTVRVRDAAGAVLADRLLETGLAHPAVHALPPPPGADGGAGPDCTYVIPVRDRPRELARLLAGLPAGSPVVVVDDASHRPGPVAAVAAEHGARLLTLTVNGGPAGARNAGLRLVTTPYVAFVDSDVVLPPDAVPTLLRHFADPRVAMAVPRITGLVTPASAGWLGRYERIRSSLDLGTDPASVRPGTPVSWVPSACVVARVDALADGFDPRLRVGEDVDLCWRLARSGLRVRYEPSVEAAHEHRVTLRDWFRRKAEYGTGAHPLAERHPRNIAPAVLAPWNAALVLALVAQRRWSLPVAAGLCAVATARIARTLRGTGQPVRHAARLTGGGAVSAVAQGSALLTRHWWPLTVLGCLVSSRIRRATAVAAVADIALEYRRDRAGLDPVRYGIARRLDDLAYGTGVWISALKGRSTAALRPRIVPARASARRKPGCRGRPGG
ncbi:mycofactocin biosynthesis glycosyltransferase MftF [Streptomyces hirsutus]|uniref:mycofactocin biosynthesis glycosyltransferase MftF n=1 Tax=Streptomyces hirsutus TaxID=35620 RepID=UPI0036B8EE5E